MGLEQDRRPGVGLGQDGDSLGRRSVEADAGAVGDEAPLKNTFYALRGSGPNDVWVASATNLIFHTDGFKNGGATWVRAPNATEEFTPPGPLYAAWTTSPDDLRLVGAPVNFEPPGRYLNSNQIVKKRSPTRASEWTRLEGTATIHGIWGSSPDDLWLIADNSIYFDWYYGQWVYTDWQVGLALHGGGRARTSRGRASTAAPTRVFVESGVPRPNDIWIVGDRGTIRHFGANETEWQVVDAPTTETLHAVWAAAPERRVGSRRVGHDPSLGRSCVETVGGGVPREQEEPTSLRRVGQRAGRHLDRRRRHRAALHGRCEMKRARVVAIGFAVALDVRCPRHWRVRTQTEEPSAPPLDSKRRHTSAEHERR